MKGWVETGGNNHLDMKSTFFRSSSLIGIAVLASGTLFLVLLAFRMDWITLHPVQDHPVIIAVSKSDSWMGIYQKSRNIGFSHRKITPREGGFDVSETTHMRLNTMGMIQEIHMNSQGILKNDFSLASFSFELESGMFHLVVRGNVNDNKLMLDANGQQLHIPLKTPIYLSENLWDAAGRMGQPDWQSITLPVFDPSTLSTQSVKLAVEGTELIEIMGTKQLARRVSVIIMGSRQTGWLAADGSVLQEEGFMGISLKKISEDEVPVSIPEASEDLTQAVSIPSNQQIEHPESLRCLVLRVTGAGIIPTERQQIQSSVVTIIKETLSDLSDIRFPELDVFLEPGPLIQSDHIKIIQQVSEIINTSDSPLARVQKIMNWIYKHIEKRPVLSVFNALETLENRMGDCKEHAALFAAMSRAAGVPSQIEAGLVYYQGNFYYHAWNSVFLGKWITVDSLMGQIPADVTHICLVRGNPEQLVNLVGAIGMIDISILEKQ